MHVMDAIQNRRSIREFTNQPVEDEKIGMILEGCKWAPSAGNRQPWEVIVVDDKEKINQFSEICLNQHWIKNVPLIMTICINQNIAGSNFGYRGQSLFAIQSSAAAAQNMMLVAKSLGLGTCWIDPSDERKVSEVLECPIHIRPVIMLAIGYPEQNPKEDRPVRRHNIHEFSHHNKFGKKENREGSKGLANTTTNVRDKLLKSLKKY